MNCLTYKFSKDEDIVIFGSGSIVVECIRFIKSVFDCRIFVFEKIGASISPLKKQASTLKKVYYYEANKANLAILETLNTGLIFSINNTFIFQKELIEKYIILNYHNALLPNHPGRYAEAWSIYDQDNYSGITWHIVNENVDEGDIISQVMIPIQNTTTALKLIMLQTKEALRIFKYIFDKLTKGIPLALKKQQIHNNVNMHYSWEIPNGGYLDTEAPENQISAFLRSLDYGPLCLRGSYHIRLNDKEYVFNKYRIEYFTVKDDRCLDISINNNNIIIIKDTMKFVAYDIKPIE